MTAAGRVIVIGAGPAGLAAAAALHARDVPTVVLERGEKVGTTWRGHYDRLHLHTVRWLSNLPGFRIPRSEGRWVSRDGVLRYLESYAAHHRLEVRTGVTVSRVEPAVPSRDDAVPADGWVLRSPQGDWNAPAVIVATGYNHTPLMPDWPGREAFTGELLHASDYRNGAAFRGRDVLVVGAGNTGAEIAVDLVEHGAGRVRLAVRRPPYILRRQRLGIPTQLTGVLMRHVPVRIADVLAEPVRKLSVPDLRHKGLADPGKGLYTRASRGEIPILDVGLVDAILADRVEPVAAVAGFDGSRVRLADGNEIEPDAVVVAVGYRRGLEPLVGHLGVLDGTGVPTVHAARTHPDAPHLHFIGFTNPPSGMFREVASDARRIAAALRADFATSGLAFSERTSV